MLLNVAKEISKATREHGAEPMGVFVEEDANEIEQACDANKISFVQLHGERACGSLSNMIQHRHIIYVLHADKNGELLTKPQTRNAQIQSIVFLFGWKKSKKLKKISKCQ